MPGLAGVCVWGGPLRPLRLAFLPLGCLSVSNPPCLSCSLHPNITSGPGTADTDASCARRHLLYSGRYLRDLPDSHLSPQQGIPCLETLGCPSSDRSPASFSDVKPLPELSPQQEAPSASWANLCSTRSPPPVQWSLPPLCPQTPHQCTHQAPLCCAPGSSQARVLYTCQLLAVLDRVAAGA